MTKESKLAVLCLEDGRSYGIGVIDSKSFKLIEGKDISAIYYAPEGEYGEYIKGSMVIKTSESATELLENFKKIYPIHRDIKNNKYLLQDEEDNSLIEIEKIDYHSHDKDFVIKSFFDYFSKLQ
jgi:hypothetical protein